ncbi:Adaptive-response sensory-kinase SasA [Ureibacillus acetophenoni]
MTTLSSLNFTYATLNRPIASVLGLEKDYSFDSINMKESINLDFSTNIISNALKYSPDGGNIRFGVTVQENLLKVMISDDGMGIPKENVGRIFDRFYRVDRARSRAMGGTGLGLAIAKEMIEAHGGSIWAESEEGVGTTVFFTLPYELEEAGEWD